MAHPGIAPAAEELRVSPAEAAQVRRGIPELPLAGPAARGAPPGTALSVCDPRGRPIAAAIADPSRAVVRVWSRRARPRFDAAFFEDKVEKALALRAGVKESSTTAYRILHGDGDGLSGFAVDAWGEFLTVQVFGTGPAVWAHLLERALARRLEPRGIVRKLVLPDRKERERGKVEEEVVFGEKPPDRLEVLEAGVPFLVRLLGSRHAGLFTDMRDERKRIAQLAAGRRVLNTFAYTGGFSVAAARGGAAEVVSVDIVPKVLEWSKENFRLSGLDAVAHRAGAHRAGAHRFVCMDAGRYLDLAKKRGWIFEIIVLDPPPFGTAGGGRWSMRSDYPALIGRALAALAPGGLLWVAANAAAVADREVDRWIAEGAARARRPVRTVARAGQPADYPAPPGFPRYRYLKIRVLRG